MLSGIFDLYKTLIHKLVNFYPLFASVQSCLFAELYKMVCDRNETDLNISIPAVMLPQDAGASLETSLQHGSSGSFPLQYKLKIDT